MTSEKVALCLGHSDIRTTESIFAWILTKSSGGASGHSARTAPWTIQGARRADRLSVGERIPIFGVCNVGRLAVVTKDPGPAPTRRHCYHAGPHERSSLPRSIWVGGSSRRASIALSCYGVAVGRWWGH